MLPEQRLQEACKQLGVIWEDDDLPDSITGDVYGLKRDITELQQEIAEWREFVDDSEVVKDDNPEHYFEVDREADDGDE